MSLFGFDALGRLALGQVAQSHNGLKGSTAICTVLGPRGLSRPPYASFAGKPADTGSASKTYSAMFSVLGPRGIPRPPWASFAGKPATIVIIPPPPETAPFLFGGVGHFKWELEEARRLAAITTRGPPGFVDLRSPVRFDPIGAPPIAPAAPAPDLAALAQQQASAQMQAAQAAKKRRRDIEAILLLAA